MRIRRAARILPALGFVLAQVVMGIPADAQPPAPKPAKPAAKTHPAAAKALPKPLLQGKPRKGPYKRTRKPGAPGEPNEATRRAIAGVGHNVRESPELRAMRELDRLLFPGRAPSSGSAWLAEGTPLLDRGEPEVIASGMPPEAKLSAHAPEPARDLAFLHKLAMPDIPVRWDARVVRYLDFYKNNPRGKAMVASWLKKSGRYGGAIRRALREHRLPEDILWLALIESGFDPTVTSPVGAAGLWQFMPDGARIYGLTVDRWIDERLDPERSTVAAARYLTDLYARFGTWELAFAAYNMGYGGLLASIRKYNTNDFWELSHVESGMPLETALYVPKIVAMAIVARNRATFGLADIELDPAVEFDAVSVHPGVTVQSVALASGATTSKLAELNPELLAGRTPPVAPADGRGRWTVRVPVGTASQAARSLPKHAAAEPKVVRHVVRWGESLDEIAARWHTTRGTIASLNALRRDESLRPGTVLLAPAPRPEDLDDPYRDLARDKPVVVVPPVAFSYPERRRLFYRVMHGDTLRDLPGVFGVTAGELCRWNALDPSATLHDGMTLQVYAPSGHVPADALVLAEKDAKVLSVGSREFFAHFEGLRGRTRLEHVAKQGETFRTVARRYGLSVAQLERINGRARSSHLSVGDKLTVYVASNRLGPAELAAAQKAEAEAEIAVANPVVHSVTPDDAKGEAPKGAP